MPMLNSSRWKIFKRKHYKRTIRCNHAVCNKILVIEQEAWTKMIGERNKNRVTMTSSMFLQNSRSNYIPCVQSFNKEITRAIENSQAVAASDAIVKDSVIAGYWIVIGMN